tara:strand:- start:91 stop:414 length:324 start_codon:yes stop_codon:yes gene_type:complete
MLLIKKMKRLLLPLLAFINLPNSINAEISDELHKKCLDARDYKGSVNTNKKTPFLKYMKISWIGIRLFLNIDTAELAIQSLINDSSAASVDIKPNDILIKIDGKSTK